MTIHQLLLVLISVVCFVLLSAIALSWIVYWIERRRLDKYVKRDRMVL